MRKKKNFRKKKRFPKEQLEGLQVKVFHNDVEKALRVLKKKIKKSNLMLDIRKKEYYQKPSDVKRHKKQMAVLRNKYNVQKNENNY